MLTWSERMSNSPDPLVRRENKAERSGWANTDISRLEICGNNESIYTVRKEANGRQDDSAVYDNETWWRKY